MSYPTHFKRGDPLPEQRQFWNDVVELLADWRRGKRRPTAVAHALHRGDVVLLQNATETGRDVTEVLALGDPLITPQGDDEPDVDDLLRGVFEGVEPVVPDSFGKAALLLEPIAAGEFGLALLRGTLWTKIDVDDVYCRFADVAADEVKLLSRHFGSAEILHKASGTGEKWAFVRLGHLQTPDWWGELQADLDYGDTGTVVLDLGSSIEDVTCPWLETGETLPAGRVIVAGNPDTGDMEIKQARACL